MFGNQSKLSDKRKRIYMNAKTSPELELQIKVSRILSLGFVFSIVWLAGVGSLVAFVSGLRVRKIINQSGGPIVGTKMAWWCIVVGALGMLVLPLMVFRQLNLIR